MPTTMSWSSGCFARYLRTYGQLAMTRNPRRRASSSAKRARAAADALTLEGRRDLGMDERDPAALDDVLEHAGQLAVEARLVALRVRRVGHDGVHGRHLSRSTSSVQPGDERIERLVEHRDQPMSKARPGDEAAMGQQRHRAAQQLDAREGIRLAFEDQHRLGDGRPMLGAEALLRLARQVQRVGEADDAGDRRPARSRHVHAGGEQRCDASAIRVAADDEPCVRRHRRQRGDRGHVRGHGVLRLALGQVDGVGIHATGPQALDVRRHRGRCPGRAVGEHEADVAA